MLLNICRVKQGTGAVDVLLGVHSPSVDIEVGVDLDRRDVLGRQYQALHASSRCTYLQTDRLEQQTRRGGCDACRQFRTYAILSASGLPMMPYRRMLVGLSKSGGTCAHLPHAADDASRHKHVFHGVAVGEGEGRRVELTADKEFCT
jgi:hypothetical protein